jgi:hypothetical protein
MPRKEENVGGQLDKSQEFFCGLLVPKHNASFKKTNKK